MDLYLLIDETGNFESENQNREYQKLAFTLIKSLDSKVLDAFKSNFEGAIKFVRSFKEKYYLGEDELDTKFHLKTLFDAKNKLGECVQKGTIKSKQTNLTFDSKELSKDCKEDLDNLNLKIQAVFSNDLKTFLENNAVFFIGENNKSCSKGYNINNYAELLHSTTLVFIPFLSSIVSNLNTKVNLYVYREKQREEQRIRREQPSQRELQNRFINNLREYTKNMNVIIKKLDESPIKQKEALKYIADLGASIIKFKNHIHSDWINNSFEMYEGIDCENIKLQGNTKVYFFDKNGTEKARFEFADVEINKLDFGSYKKNQYFFLEKNRNKQLNNIQIKNFETDKITSLMPFKAFFSMKNLPKLFVRKIQDGTFTAIVEYKNTQDLQDINKLIKYAQEISILKSLNKGQIRIENKTEINVDDNAKDIYSNKTRDLRRKYENLIEDIENQKVINIEEIETVFKNYSFIRYALLLEYDILLRNLQKNEELFSVQEKIKTIDDVAFFSSMLTTKHYNNLKNLYYKGNLVELLNKINEFWDTINTSIFSYSYYKRRYVNLISEALSELYELDFAEKFLEENLSELKNADLKEIYRSKGLLAEIYARKGSFDKALELYQSNLNENLTQEDIIRTKNYIANMYLLKNETQKAKDIFKECLENYYILEGYSTLMLYPLAGLAACVKYNEFKEELLSLGLNLEDLIGSLSKDSPENIVVAVLKVIDNKFDEAFKILFEARYYLEAYDLYNTIYFDKFKDTYSQEAKKIEDFTNKITKPLETLYQNIYQNIQAENVFNYSFKNFFNNLKEKRDHFLTYRLNFANESLKRHI
ncbi:MAG: tetratricopeptide repeat protein [Desulfurella sp.]|uniref:tetratricopeptide repeat protein n=1 Tax=Desulfurella sp. TaxID=1962857 RepID=UPI003D0EFCF9